MAEDGAGKGRLKNDLTHLGALILFLACGGAIVAFCATLLMAISAPMFWSEVTRNAAEQGKSVAGAEGFKTGWFYGWAAISACAAVVCGFGGLALWKAAEKKAKAPRDA